MRAVFPEPSRVLPAGSSQEGQQVSCRPETDISDFQTITFSKDKELF